MTTETRPDTLAIRRGSYATAREQLSIGQRWTLSALLIVLLIGFLLGIPLLKYVMGFILLATVCYLGSLVFNSFLIWSATFSEALIDVSNDLGQLDRSSLPTYSVLVPLYKETRVVADLIHNLCALDYPVDKLKIILLLEADDVEMLKTVQPYHLPPHFRTIIVPVSKPRTKPKALNIGLRHIDSEFCVVYDAEDRPDPDQLLMAIAAFNKVGPKVVCLQAQLAYHNPGQNWLTRFFASEYASWFTLYIPGLAQNDLLFLLGGTSNHFRSSALRLIGAWDPFNVTEDADLGIRLARAGMGVKALKSTTWEEANSHPVSWVKQRSRWIKGYMQTYLAHMRDPLRLFKEMGWKRFVAFQFMVGVAPFAHLINPLFWSLTILYWITRSPLIESLYPGPLLYVGTLSLVLGNFIVIFVSLTGAMLQKDYGSIKWMLFTPVYWVMMSVAAWRAFWQLIFNPHYWEKTQHGLHNVPTTTPRLYAGWAGQDNNPNAQPVSEKPTTELQVGS